MLLVIDNRHYDFSLFVAVLRRLTNILKNKKLYSLLFFFVRSKPGQKRVKARA
ncbi:MAG: hypothetical protein WBM58_10290 [Sedimenticolaceae bacterium]